MLLLQAQNNDNSFARIAIMRAIFLHVCIMNVKIIAAKFMKFYFTAKLFLLMAEKWIKTMC